MTGYGRGTQTIKDKTITIEIRSLNSKFTDIRFKLPQNYKEKELELRKRITKHVERGKIDVNLEVKSLDGDEEYALNEQLFLKYFKSITAIQRSNSLPVGDLTQAVLKLPNVISADADRITEEEWVAVQEALSNALEQFDYFRKTEGQVMEEDCKKRISSIQHNLGQVEPYEKNRINKLRQRIQLHMEEYVGKDNIDANRFEQEILYYLERIDITEEKVRLEQHCQFFLEELEKKTTMKGRKLNFISQEMGREINTLGSKANSSDIQRLVVMMKDELEKIKEQVANSL